MRPSKESVKPFVYGVVATLAVSAFAKSKTAHKLAVSGMAGGMRVKENALRKAESIREEAKDIYEEARRETEVID